MGTLWHENIVECMISANKLTKIDKINKSVWYLALFYSSNRNSQSSFWLIIDYFCYRNVENVLKLFLERVFFLMSDKMGVECLTVYKKNECGGSWADSILLMTEIVEWELEGRETARTHSKNQYPLKRREKSIMCWSVASHCMGWQNS